MPRITGEKKDRVLLNFDWDVCFSSHGARQRWLTTGTVDFLETYWISGTDPEGERSRSEDRRRDRQLCTVI